MCFSNTYVGKIARHIKAMGDVMKENDKPRMCFVASIKNRIKFFLKKQVICHIYYTASINCI